MAGLVPAIDVFGLVGKESKTWITGSGPVMTVYLLVRRASLVCSELFSTCSVVGPD
jgi:hypothetical protein